MAKFPTIESMAREIAEKALDEYVYKGKTIRQWIDDIIKYEKLSSSKEVERDSEIKITNKVYNSRNEELQDRIAELQKEIEEYEKNNGCSIPKIEANEYVSYKCMCCENDIM